MIIMIIIILINDDGSLPKWGTPIPREVGQVAQRKQSNNHHPNNHLKIFSFEKVIFKKDGW
jgi:hypothetical protein